MHGPLWVQAMNSQMAKAHHQRFAVSVFLSPERGGQHDRYSERKQKHNSERVFCAFVCHERHFKVKRLKLKCFLAKVFKPLQVPHVLCFRLQPRNFSVFYESAQSSTWLQSGKELGTFGFRFANKNLNSVGSIYFFQTPLLRSLLVKPQGNILSLKFTWLVIQTSFNLSTCPTLR